MTANIPRPAPHDSAWVQLLLQALACAHREMAELCSNAKELLPSIGDPELTLAWASLERSLGALAPKISQALDQYKPSSPTGIWHEHEGAHDVCDSEPDAELAADPFEGLPEEDLPIVGEG